MDKIYNINQYYFKVIKNLTIIFVFIMCLSLSATASVFGQQKRDFDIVNKNLSSALSIILEDSGYNIIYTVKDVNNGSPVNKTLKNVTVEDALTQVLRDKGLTYIIKDKNIVISKIDTKQVVDKVEISGTVIDAHTKAPIMGATVLVANSSIGTVSDDKGRFKLNVAPNSKLEILFVGMKTQTYQTKGSQKDIVISLETDVMGVDEIVVTGYKRATKNRTTGSVAVLNQSELKDAPLRSMDMLMQGKIAGVSVQSVSGKPGQTAKIRIRGTNTMTGNADPLWVVDGVMLQKDIPSISASSVKSGDFSTLFADGIAGINPNDIESITVLKDASAAAIYGSRAASGVIVVTTKRGKEGKIRINYSGGLSIVTAPVRDVNLMNSAEKIKFETDLWDEFSSAGFNKGERYPVVGVVGMVKSGYGKFKGMSTSEQDSYLQSLTGSTTNWFDELFRKSVSHNHYLSLSGGTEKSDYYVSLGYSKNNGLLKNNNYERYSLSSKLGFKINKRLSLDFNTSLSYQTAKDASSGVNVFDYAYFANPYEKPYNADGSYKSDDTYFDLGKANGNMYAITPDNGINIMRELNETHSLAKSFSMSENISLNWNIFDNLRFEGIGSLSYTNNTSDNINGENTYAAFLDRPFDPDINSQRKYGSITQSSAYNTSYSLRGQFSYNKSFGEHNISALAGSEIRSQYAKSIFEKRYGYDPVTGNSSMPIYPNPTGSGTIEYNDLIAYAKIMDGLAGQSIDENAVASFYFSTDYSYSNRYTVSFTARTDGSNNFGSKEQFNPIWSVGALWNIRNEGFMAGKAKAISSLTLRAATGYTGNINKSVYPQFIMDYENSFRTFGDKFIRMGRVGSAPNAFLRWERTFDYKLGLSIGLFKDRLSLQAEAYNRLSSDVVSQVAVPTTTGFTTQSFNTSKIQNQGVELTIMANILQHKDYSITLSANAAYNQNKLVEYNSPNGKSWGSTYEGYPLNSIFGGKYIGVDQYTGVYLFQGRSDAKFDTKADYTDSNNYLFYLGTSNAPVTGGYSLSGRWKQLSLSIGGTFSLGGKVSNKIAPKAGYGSIGGSTVGGEIVPTYRNDLYANHQNVLKKAANRWTETNKITNGYPRLIDAYAPAMDYETFMTTSSYITDGVFLENVSYFKINSISLSYSIAENIVKKWGIGSLGVSVIANNILTVSNYSGFDPETPGAIYPQSKSFSLSLSIGF